MGWLNRIVWGKDDYEAHDTDRPAVVRGEKGNELICNTLSSTDDRFGTNWVTGDKGTEGFESDESVTRDKAEVKSYGEFVDKKYRW